MTAGGAAPDDPGRRFAAAMAHAAPFESRPHLAVALSGGADSSALALLAREWALVRGGRVTALTVDHGLRHGSAAEADAVGSWCRTHAIDHVVLRWEGLKPARAIQERARDARHALLEGWCRAAGVLHLLLGHHADDQSETVALRRLKGSGADGLDGMAAIVERTDIRLLRPLLGWRRAELRSLLRARGVHWIEDPSNRDTRFARARLRAAGGLDESTIPRPAVRRAAEQRRARWLGMHAAVHPEGWVCLRLDAFRALDPATATSVLRAALMTVSGRVHPPRQRSLSEASNWVRAAAPGASRSVAGCVMSVTQGRLSVLRNPAACRGDLACASEAWFDGRFRVRLPVVADMAGARLVPLRSLAAARDSRRRSPALMAGGLLPVVRKLDGSVGVLHVLYGRGSLALVSVDSTDVSFRPIRSLAGAAFAGPETVKLSSTPESPLGLAPVQARLPERVVPS